MSPRATGGRGERSGVHRWALVLGVGWAVAAGGCAADRVGPVAHPSPVANVLLVTLDTVRADRIGAYGARDAATPALDGLAGRGARFARATTAAPLTLPAHATILTGLYPLRHGLRDNGAGSLAGEVPTLATALAGAGRRTGAFVGAFVLDRRFGLARGFEVYDDEIDRGERAGFEAERPGREVVDRALAWLGRDDPRPFFAWVHLYDAHAPYEPPEPYRTRFAGRPYEGEIAAVDAEVARLLAWLDERGLAGSTAVAVVGDHGEGLGEHGELTHGLLLYESTLAVPLLVAAPGRLPAGRVVETPVGVADLAPTLAALAGVRLSPARPPDGRDLSAPLARGEEPPPADLYAETEYPSHFGWSPLAALRRGEVKYLEAPRPELYDLATDPGETVDRRGERRREAATLAAALTALRAAAPAVAAAPADLDEEARARLASLGYVGAVGRRAGPAADPKDRVELFRRFEEAHWAVEEGRPGEAAAVLVELAAADPGNPVFRSELARALREQGDLPRAVEVYREAVAADPGNPQGWYDLAVTLQEAGRPREAGEALAAAIARDPRRPEAHNALGVALAATGRTAEARDAFAEATELDPGNARAFNNLGNALRDLERPQEAAQAYRRAAELAPAYPDPLNGLGTLAVAADRPREAIGYFDRALALAPAQHEIRLNRAIALELAGETGAAASAYRDFLAASAGDAGYTRQREAAERLLARLTRDG